MMQINFFAPLSFNVAALTGPETYNWKEIFSRIAIGDGASFEIAYNYFYPKMFAVAFAYVRNREIAEDTVQQILLKVWEKRADLSAISHPVTWLYTGAKYEIWEAIRKSANSHKRETKFADAGEQDDPGPDKAMIFRQQLQIIENSIRALSPRQQQVYRMSREEGKTYQEIADHLGISRETVKELIANALKNMRKSLDSYKDEFLLILFTIFFS